MAMDVGPICITIPLVKWRTFILSALSLSTFGQAS